MSEITHRWEYEEESGTEEMPAGPAYWLISTLEGWAVGKPYPVAVYDDEPMRHGIESAHEEELRRMASDPPQQNPPEPSESPQEPL